jgi:hypothetical protein
LWRSNALIDLISLESESPNYKRPVGPERVAELECTVGSIRNLISSFFYAFCISALVTMLGVMQAWPKVDEAMRASMILRNHNIKAIDSKLVRAWLRNPRHLSVQL